MPVVVDVVTKPIPRDEHFEGMNKNLSAYREQKRRRICISCENLATQMLRHKMEGCTKIERYCDSCLEKVNKRNEI